MMEPEVRYCTTSDGVRIAYTVTGEGPPIVWCVDTIVSHVQLEWGRPTTARVQGAAARQNTLVRLDFRGSGLSDRVQADGLNDYIKDVEAVVARTGFQEFCLIANSTAAPAGIAYTAEHPEQVSRLVLVDAYARGSDIFEAPQAKALFAAASLDWTLATETIGYLVFGPGSEENTHHGEYIRACVGPEVFNEEVLAKGMELDVSDLAAEITAPTLIIKHSGLSITSMEAARHLATQIPNARLVVIEGTWIDTDEFIQKVLLFLNGEAPTPASPAPVEAVAGTAIILFADIVDSTALTERVGDSAFREKARDLDTALRGLIREHSGTPIEGKLLGDGVLATFASARQAIEAALACGVSGASAGLPLHLGLHAGDVIHEDNNVFGGAVNIASRISGLSAPGEVLVSQTVRDLARTSAGVSFEDCGEQALKGVSEPVRVWAVTPLVEPL